MSDSKKNAVRKFVTNSVGQMSDSEKKEVLDWAERSLTIVQNPSLTRKEKLLELKKIKSTKAVLNFILSLARFIKLKAWDERSWAMRMTFGGAAVGLATFGTKAAGLAALGTAVGVPLALITATGAMALGVLVDELRKKV